jgi:hypothetical protein
MKLDLEALAARRADEQMAVFRFNEVPVRRVVVPMTEGVCKWPGCTRRLRKNNRSGYCYRCTQTHQRQTNPEWYR